MIVRKYTSLSDWEETRFILVTDAEDTAHGVRYPILLEMKGETLMHIWRCCVVGDRLVVREVPPQQRGSLVYSRTSGGRVYTSFEEAGAALCVETLDCWNRWECDPTVGC